MTVTQTRLFPLFGSTVSAVAREVLAVTVRRFLSLFRSFGLGVATNVETTLSPGSRVKYRQEAPPQLPSIKFS